MSPSIFLERFLQDTSAGAASDLFVVLIVLVFIGAAVVGWRGRSTPFLDYAPNVMTSLGILGTFTGIIIGLLHFDPEHIDSSIAMLLGGLKTAFITSFVGMGSSISFKALDGWIFSPRRKRLDEGRVEDITPQHIHAVLNRGNELLENVHAALGGDEENSLMGQLRLARTDLADSSRQQRQDRAAFEEKLWTELAGVAEMLSRSATEQIIDALRQVIADFNESLTEQFGENFKRLDESVKKLVDWQAQYMVQLEHMSEQYDQGVQAIGETRDAVGQISASAGEIPAHLEHLRGVLEVNQHQIQELQRHLEAFVTMRDRAVEAVPTINAHLKQVGDELSQAAYDMRIALLEGATEFGQSVDKTNMAMTSLANDTAAQGEKISGLLDDSATELHKTVRDVLARLESGGEQMQAGIESTVANTLARMEGSGDTLQAGIDRAVEHLLGQMQTSVAHMQTSVDHNVEQVLNELGTTVEQTLAGLRAQVGETVGQTSEAMNKTLAALHDALQAELENVMGEMGTALVTITERFTGDYGKLLQAMRAATTPPVMLPQGPPAEPAVRAVESAVDSVT